MYRSTHEIIYKDHIQITKWKQNGRNVPGRQKIHQVKFQCHRLILALLKLILRIPLFNNVTSRINQTNTIFYTNFVQTMWLFSRRHCIALQRSLWLDFVWNNLSREKVSNMYYFWSVKKNLWEIMMKNSFNRHCFVAKWNFIDLMFLSAVVVIRSFESVIRYVRILLNFLMYCKWFCSCSRLLQAMENNTINKAFNLV